MLFPPQKYQLYLQANLNDHESIKKEEASFKDIPVIRDVDSDIVQMNYFQIKEDIQDLVSGKLHGREEVQPHTDNRGGYQRDYKNGLKTF